MKRLAGMLMVFVLTAFVPTSIVPLARGAPTKKAFTAEQVIAVQATVPNVVLKSIPPLTTGYDVICNRSEAVTTVAGLSTTVAERRRGVATYLTCDGRQPSIVLLS